MKVKLHSNQNEKLTAAPSPVSVAASAPKFHPVAGAAGSENATMYGKITFMELSDLAEFLAKWQETKSTAVFEVKQDGNYRWVLEFTGGF